MSWEQDEQSAPFKDFHSLIHRERLRGGILVPLESFQKAQEIDNSTNPTYLQAVDLAFSFDSVDLSG